MENLSYKSVEDFISSVAGNAVVTPEGLVGTGGFVFDVVGNEEVTLEAEATDHYLEDNTAAQDHITLRPVMITLKGYMGEITDKTQGVLAGVLSTVESLGDIGGLAPSFAQQASQVYSKIEGVVTKVNNVLSQANNIYSIFSQKSTTQTAGQKAFQFFENLWANRILCVVETPFKTYINMMIIRLGAIGPEESKTVSNFTVTFKQVRTVASISTAEKSLSGRAADMVADLVEKGTAGARSVDTAAILNDFVGNGL